MKLILKLLFALLPCCLVIVWSCNDLERVETKEANFSILTAPSCIQGVDNDLPWMARGIAEIVSVYAVRNTIEVEMLKSSFNEVSNRNADSAVQANTGVLIDNEVVNSINNNFPSNDYIGGYFFDFDCNDCKWSTGLYSPNIRDVNIDPSTTLYVVPSMEDVDVDSLRGYYVNSFGNLDSVWVNEDFLDNNYVWVVTSSSNCKPLICPSNPGGGSNGDDNLKGKKADWGPCNFDDNCDNDPFCGGRETVENCPDCGANIIQNSLYLLSYSMNNDVKGGGAGPQDDYQEGWIRNRYELALQTLLYRPIYDGTGAINGYSYITGSRTSSDDGDLDVNPTGSELEVPGDVHDLQLLKVGRGASDVTRCRIKRSGKLKCSGNNSSFNERKLISQSYLPIDVFYFILYERDKRTWHHKEWTSPDASSSGAGGSLNIQRNMYFVSQKRPYTQNAAGGYAFRIDASSTWQAETIDGVNYNTCTESLDGEITVKFGYTAN
jgi:hypothetical protein